MFYLWVSDYDRYHINQGANGLVDKESLCFFLKFDIWLWFLA